MKVFLKNQKTGMFLGPGKTWVRKSKACVFNHSAKALEFCLDNTLEGMEIVLSFGKAKYDVSMAVDSGSRAQV